MNRLGNRILCICSMCYFWLWEFNVGGLPVIAPIFPDIKQCAMNNGGCQQVCTELIPGFQCSCQAGYVLASNGFNCTGKAHWPAVFAVSLTF